jgi:hypothetical protein
MQYTLNDINWNDVSPPSFEDNTIIGLENNASSICLNTNQSKPTPFNSIETFTMSDVIRVQGEIDFGGVANFNNIANFNNNVNFNNTSFTSTAYFYNGMTVYNDSKFNNVSITNTLRFDSGYYGPDFVPLIKCLPNILNALGFTNSWDIQQIANSTGYFYESPALNAMNDKIQILQDKITQLEQRCAKI